MAEFLKPVSLSDGAEAKETNEAPPQEKLTFVAQVRALLQRCAPDKVAIPILEYIKEKKTADKDAHGELIRAADVIAGILGEFRRKGTSPDNFPQGFGYKLNEPVLFLGLDKQGALRISGEKAFLGYSPQEIINRLTSFLDTGIVEPIELRADTEQPSQGASGGYQPDPDWFYDVFRNMHSQAQANERARQRRAERRARFMQGLADIQNADSVEALRDVIYRNEFVVRSNTIGERDPFDIDDIRPGSTGRHATNRYDEWSWEASERGVALWLKKLNSLSTADRAFPKLIALHAEARDFFESMWASQTSAYGRAVTNEIEMMFMRSVDDQIRIAKEERWSKGEIGRRILEPFLDLFHPMTPWFAGTTQTREYSDARRELRKVIDQAPLLNMRRLIQRKRT